jgi:hypothetical protein
VQVVYFPEYLELTEVNSAIGIHLAEPNPSVAELAAVTPLEDYK